MNAIFSSILSALLPLLLKVLTDNLPAILAALLKNAPGWISTNAPIIAAQLGHAHTANESMQQAGVAPAQAATDAAAMAAKTILATFNGAPPPDLKAFLAGLPIPITLPSSPKGV